MVRDHQRKVNKEQVQSIGEWKAILSGKKRSKNTYYINEYIFIHLYAHKIKKEIKIRIEKGEKTFGHLNRLIKCKLWIHTFSKIRKMFTTRKKNLSLETLMPEGSGITCEKSRDINRKKKQQSLSMTGEAATYNVQTRTKYIFLKTFKDYI